MGFLSPFLLISATALAVPLWLHLRRKRRQTPVEFPSLRYLKMAAARMKRQARLEDVGLLLLRLLLVALLAAAFARPVIRSKDGWFGSGRSVESVVVIDATASMAWNGENGSRFDAAKRLAREWIDGLDRSDAVALWVLTDQLEQPVPVPITDRAHLFSVIDSLKPSEGSSSLAPVFNAAREWADTRSSGRKELILITDNQPAAWDWPAEEFFRQSWKSSGTSLVVLSPDSSVASNVLIRSVEWSEKDVRAGGLLSGIVKLANYGDAAVSDLLECRVAGQVLHRMPVNLPAGGSLDLLISLGVPAIENPVLSGELVLAGDSLSSDDRWCFAIPVRRMTNSLVVERGGSDGGMRPSFFLTRALSAGSAGKASAIESATWIRQSTDDMDSVWFTGGAILDEAAWKKALVFAESGGTVVVTGDTQPKPLPVNWPVTIGEEINLPAGRMATRLLATSHPLFEGVWSERTPFPPLPQRIARGCQPASGARLLAALAGEYPLLVESPHGKGLILWLNASADRAWGDLPLSPAYVPLVQQIARSKSLIMQAATSAWVGEAWPELTNFPNDARWSAVDGIANSTRTPQSGVFDAVSKDGKNQWNCAVNVRRAESDLRSLESSKLQAMLPGRVAAGTRGIREWREQVRRDVPLWPWLLGAAALVFLAEAWASAFADKLRENPKKFIMPMWMGRRSKS